ncbi:MAG TPA: hypothetical protein ENK06_14365 [Gammaproteobacteria bacterium]|nr:hypothetical protein [Gammaproteobacteria bacterium]
MNQAIEANSTSIRTDRRKKKSRSFVYSFVMRRRRHFRREEDKRNNLYVDVHETQVFILFSLTILLSVTDAVFTLYIVNNGGEEVNPVMRYLINSDVNAFFWAKYFMTSFGMLFLVSHKHFVLWNVIRGYHIMYAIFGIYVSLVSYEMYLISQMYATR